MLEATKLVGAFIAQSLVHVTPPPTAAQWRVLVLTSRDGSTATEVAQDLGIHRSNGGRLCDRLVSAGLLERRVDCRDNRRVLLVHTPAGRALYEGALDYRRDRIRHVMTLMSASDRELVVRASDTFLAAAASIGDDEPVGRGAGRSRQSAD